MNRLEGTMCRTDLLMKMTPAYNVNDTAGQDESQGSGLAPLCLRALPVSQYMCSPALTGRADRHVLHVRTRRLSIFSIKYAPLHPKGETKFSATAKVEVMDEELHGNAMFVGVPKEGRI